MPDLKASKDSLTLLLGARAAGDFQFEANTHLPSEKPRVLKIYTISALLCSLNGTIKPEQ